MGYFPVAQRMLSLYIFAGLVVVFIISLYHGGYLASLSVKAGVSPVSEKDRPPLSHNFGSLLFELYKPIKLPVDATRFTDRYGKVFGTEGRDYWKTPMGSDILVVDIDTRIPDGKNGIFNATKMNWDAVEASGAGLLTISHLNHYLYSQIHGYDYQFFHAQKMKDHWDTWIKPHVFQRMLRNHKFIVFVDADAIIQHLEVPLEFLMNRWNISQSTSIAMPVDTQQLVGDNKENISTDSKGRVVLNSGFVVLQNLPHTHDMLQAWSECTTEKRYPGCGQWKDRWSHEQRAFSEYIRYDFNPQGNNIVEIPCADANGYPGLFGAAGVIDDCQGDFVRHYTLNKEGAKASTSDVLMQGLSEVLQKNFETNHKMMLIEE